MPDILNKIGNQIRKYRKLHELSQNDLAERAGISYKYLGEIERGQAKLSVEILMKIAQALNLNASKLVSVEDYETEEQATASSILAELSEKERKIALEMLQVLKQNTDKQQ